MSKNSQRRLKPLFRYVPFKENMHCDEIGNYITFGIKAFDSDNREIMSVPDVSTDETFVIGLCRKCNEQGLSPVHLLYIIEDNSI